MTGRQLVRHPDQQSSTVLQPSMVLQARHAAGHIAVDAGIRCAGDPTAAVEAATVVMQVADHLAVRLGACLGEASPAVAHGSDSGTGPGAGAGSEPGR